MCGFLGGISSSPFSPHLVSKALRFIQNRGPDDTNLVYTNNGKCFLAHTRLAINGIHSPYSAQPISSTKDSHLVFNGEIYNHLSLRNSASPPLSDNWLTTCDTETLLGVLDSSEPSQVPYLLSGMYAFAYIRNNNLWLARDPYGEKPLYYYHQGDTYLLSSSLRSIATIVSTLSLSLSAAKHYALFGYYPPQETVFSELKNHFSAINDETRGRNAKSTEL